MTMTLEQLQGRIAELTSQLEKARAVAGLNDAEKAHLRDLDEEAAEAFVAKSATERAIELAALAKSAADENPVVYKSADGTEFRKNDDTRLVDMAKKADLLAKSLEKAAAEREDAEFEKSAGEVFGKSAPGDTKTRVAVLRAVSGIKDEAVRKSALDMLKGLSNGFAKMSAEVGTSDTGNDSGNGAEDQLVKMAQDRAKADGTDFHKAYAKVLDTEEGRALYSQIRGA